MKQRIDYVVRRAVSCDAAKIAEIEKECFSSPWSENQIIEEINKENVIFLVAESGSRLIGYISGQMILDEFYISNIAVNENFRREGVGSAIIDELINDFEKRPCVFVTLEVRESNTGARYLYEKFGFENQGIRKNFYSHPSENACIYTLYFKENQVNSI